MANRRVGGILVLKINGEIFQAKGEFTYSLLQEKRESVVGVDGVHGFKSMPVAPFIEGAVTDSSELKVEQLLTLRDASATLELANGKVILLRDCYYVADGQTTTMEGEIQLRLEGLTAAEVR